MDEIKTQVLLNLNYGGNIISKMGPRFTWIPMEINDYECLANTPCDPTNHPNFNIGKKTYDIICWDRYYFYHVFCHKVLWYAYIGTFWYVQNKKARWCRLKWTDRQGLVRLKDAVLLLYKFPLWRCYNFIFIMIIPMSKKMSLYWIGSWGLGTKSPIIC